MTEVTMATILENVGTFVTSAVGWMGDFLTEITASPVLTIFVCCVPLCGLGIGLLNRLFRTN